MQHELRPHLVMPTHDTTRAVALGAGVALLAAGLAMLVVVVPTAPAPPIVEPTPTTVVLMPVGVAPMPAPALEPRAGELELVVQVGGSSYMKLAAVATADAADGEIMPRHAAVTLHEEDGTMSAVGVVKEGDVPAAHRLWKDRQVVVDGGCTARVTGFAVVARLVGDPGYAGLTGDRWTAAEVFARGAPVLAARLGGCAGGTFARDAALPAIAIPEELHDAALAAAARQLLIDSPAARETQADWVEAGQAGSWYAHHELATHVVRHPRTGVTWVSVHGHADYACGGPTVNVWGLFRVEPGGKLAAVQLRQLGDLQTIERLIDVDGDGELELIGRGWLALDLVAVRAGGDELARLAVPFYGCPC